VHINRGPAGTSNREAYVYVHPSNQFERPIAYPTAREKGWVSSSTQVDASYPFTEDSSSSVNHFSDGLAAQNRSPIRSNTLSSAQNTLNIIPEDIDMVDGNTEYLESPVHDCPSQPATKTSPANFSPNKHQSKHKRASSGFNSFSSEFKDQYKEERGRPLSWASLLSSISGSLTRLSRSTLASSHRSPRVPLTPEEKELRLEDVPPVPSIPILPSPGSEHARMVWWSWLEQAYAFQGSEMCHDYWASKKKVLRT
jgi:hypothetical protein